MIPEAQVNTRRPLCRQEGESSGWLVPSEWREYEFPFGKELF